MTGHRRIGPRRPAGRRGARLVLAALLALGVAGCGGGGGDGPAGGPAETADPLPAAGPDGPRATRVAADPDASASDIVAAGVLTDVAVAGSRLELRSYEVSEEDDEGFYASAWRIVEPDGTAVAEGLGTRVREQSARLETWAVGEDFLQERPHGGYRVLDADGEATQVTLDPAPTPTAPGDVLVGPVQRGAGPEVITPAFFRPGDGRLHLLPRSVPRPGGPEAVALDDTGGLWVLPRSQPRGGVVVASSPDGGRTWQTERVPTPGGTYVNGVSVAGGRVWLPTVDSLPGRLGPLIARPVSGGAWRPADLGAGERARSMAPRLVDVDDRTALLADEVYLVGVDAHFRPLAPPFPRAWPQILAAGGRLYAVTYTEPVQVSDDRGRTWRPLPG